MALQVDRPELEDAAGEMPVVVCIALDHSRRQQLARLLDGVGVLVFTRDLETARSMLGRQARSAVSAGDRTVVRVGKLEVDQVRCHARWCGRTLPLTARERDLLALVASEPSRAWSYRELHAAAWSGRYLDPGPVHAAVKRLRRKLREAGVRPQLEAVRGVGYRLTDPDNDR